MAGTSAGFDAAGFRTAIRSVYALAAPPNAADQMTFHFPTKTTFTGVVDGDNVPFDPAAPATSTTPAAVTVDCGIEYLGASDDPVAFGVVLPTKVRVTLLDEDYAKIKGATYVVLGGEKYVYHHTQPPAGLFDVGLYTLVFVAENDL